MTLRHSPEGAQQNGAFYPKPQQSTSKASPTCLFSLVYPGAVSDGVRHFAYPEDYRTTQSQIGDNEDVVGPVSYILQATRHMGACCSERVFNCRRGDRLV
uniref:Uncharacterized protein n=1 Tax=Timema cristinae TaxID=61476 RepID=A0A7R9CJU7_TIMCR|nr:unnamed protein product [Timema cristinae]